MGGFKMKVYVIFAIILFSMSFNFFGNLHEVAGLSILRAILMAVANVLIFIVLWENRRPTQKKFFYILPVVGFTASLAMIVTTMAN
jgi:amino acid transporter